MKIGTKLTVTYILIVVITFAMLGAIFNGLMQAYLIRQTQVSLINEGKKIIEVYGRINKGLRGRTISEGKLSLTFLNNLLEGEFAIFDKDKKMVYPQTQIDTIRNRMAKIIGNKLLRDKENKMVIDLKDQKLVAVSIPFIKDDSSNNGWIVLYTRLSSIKVIRNSLTRVLLRALLITGIGAAVLGILFSRSITRPLKKLAKKADYMAKRDFRQRIKIKTGDELEELGNSFNRMGVQLEEYYNAQKRFLQNVSHDFKTPLMSIQGYSEGIMDGIIDGKEEQQEALQVIIDECQRLKKMVEEVIYLSKLESFKEIYEPKDEQVLLIVGDSIKKVKSLADKKGVKILLKEFENISLSLDSDKIIKALVNILGNSIRYAETEIVVTGKRKRNGFVIKIEDDGPGLEKGKEKDIFKRFHKGYKGDTGLGLAITKAVLEGHHGTVKAENREEGGCRFIVKLPV